ncbi:MAG: hypothetical protein HRT44_12405, partial [Bdellovibrionales bacterium]|nr:hypothetical protein [Bdellovibrionales bacterium]
MTFILVGLWHNLSLNWVLFGLVHALALLVNYYLKGLIKDYKSKLSVLTFSSIGILFMYILYFISGVLHRSKDIEQAYQLTQSALLLNQWNIETYYYLQYALTFLLPLILFEAFQTK